MADKTPREPIRMVPPRHEGGDFGERGNQGRPNVTSRPPVSKTPQATPPPASKKK